MSDLIKNDIEKIEQALNIRLDDVSNQIDFEQIDRKEENKEEEESHCRLSIDLNCFYQKNLFDLSDDLQTMEDSNRTNDHQQDNVQVQFNQLFKTSRFIQIVDLNSIQQIRRSIAKDEKSRLCSKETIEKLIDFVSKSIRQSTSKDIKQSNRDLIVANYDQCSIEWKNYLEEQINENKSSRSYEYIWNEICYPKLKFNDEWSKDEDRRLIDLVEKFGSFADQWKSISSFFPKRSTYLCLHRFMSLENRRFDHLKLTNDQENLLKDLVQTYRENNYVPLNRIAHQFGLSLSRIRRQWRLIDPNIRRGSWTKQEDQFLLQSVHQQNHWTKLDWNLISSNLIGRSSMKCYQRYFHLKQCQNKKIFDFDEDQRLIDEHQRKQGRWKDIQRCFPTRSSYSLQNRWKKLNQYRQINILFDQQQDKVKQFLLHQYSSKQRTNNDQSIYREPNISLTYKQLKCLTSFDLFLQFCLNLDSSKNLPQIGIRQLLQLFSRSNNIQEINRDLSLFKEKKTSRNRIQPRNNLQ